MIVESPQNSFALITLCPKLINDDLSRGHTVEKKLEKVDVFTAGPQGCASNGLRGSMPSTQKWVKLNVGGKVFQTTKQTLMREPNSFLFRLCQDHEQLGSDRDETGAFLIDRDPDYFSPILNYLRHGKLIFDRGISEEAIREEAEFYNLPMLVAMLNERILERDSIVECERSKQQLQCTKTVYRLLQCHGEELTSTVSSLSDSWKLVQVMPSGNNSYVTDQSHEYLLIVMREYPDSGQVMETQDRAGHIQQRARNN